MEAENDGMLVRQHHSWNIRIRKVEGFKYHIKRVAHENEFTIVCNSPYVSKNHGEIFRKDRAYWIRDVGSTNGTYLNGLKILRERELRFGDIIGLGVSHAETDPNINVAGSDYFVFTFTQAPVEDKPAVSEESSGSEDEIEVVYESPAAAVSKSSGVVSKKKKPDQLWSSISLSDENDERIKEQDPKPSSSSVASSKTSGVKVKKTKYDKAESKSGNIKPEASTSGSTKSSEAIPHAQKISLPDALGAKTSKTDDKNASTKSKISLKDSAGRKPPKKKIVEILSPSSSSSSGDDSSDGLGEPKEPLPLPRKPVVVNKENSHVYSGVSSPSLNGSSSDEEPVRGVRSHSDGEPNDWAEEESSLSDPETDYRYLAGKKGHYENEPDQTREDELKRNHLKELALNSNPQIKIPRVMCHMPDRERVRIVKHVRDMLTPENRRNLRIQYLRFLNSHNLQERRKKEKQIAEKKARNQEVVSSFNSSVYRNSAIEEISKGDTDKTDSRLLEKRRRLIKPPLPSSSSDDSEDEHAVDVDLKHQKKRPKIIPESDDGSSEEAKHVGNGMIDDDGGEVEGGDVDSELDNMDLDFKEDTGPANAFKCHKSSDATASSSSSWTRPQATSSEKPKPPGGQRMGIQLIDNFPQPRFAAVAQAKNAVYKSPAPPLSSKLKNIQSKSTIPLSELRLTEEEKKQLRKEKLKIVEMQKKEEREKEEKPKKPCPPATAKIKITKRNRNQDLMEDIVGKKFNDTESLIGEPVPVVAPRETQPLVSKPPPYASLIPRPPSPPFTIPPPPPTVNKVIQNLLKLAETAAPKANVAKTDVPKADVAKVDVPKADVPKAKSDPVVPVKLCDPRLERRNGAPRSTLLIPCPQIAKPKAKDSVASSSSSLSARINKQPSEQIKINVPARPRGILKPGADIMRSPPPGIGIAYREPVVPKSISRIRQKTYIPPFCPEDTIYKEMVRWNPSWIEEQKVSAEPPPDITNDVSLTVKTYHDFKAYFSTYYPLLRNEIWATVCTEIERGTSETKERNKRCSSYKIVIDEALTKNYFPITTHSKRKYEKDDVWLVIKYQAFVKYINEIDTKKDFLKLTVSGVDKTHGGEVLKSLFAFSMFNTEQYTALSKHVDCDGRLVGKERNGFRFTERIFCRIPSSYGIDQRKVATIERLCYITPKIREFKALNMLQSFPLFNNIIAPPEVVKNSWAAWSSKKQDVTEGLITFCSQNLNEDQRSMVKFISGKVFGDDPELMLMHGPPGTGKTLTIVALVLQLLNESHKRMPRCDHRRILICTPSNAAIDEIMRRLIQAQSRLPSTFNGGKRLDILRIGEGYSKDLEAFSLSSKLKGKEEEMSVTQNLKVELTSVETEIEDKKREVDKLKTAKANVVSIQSKQQTLKELENKKTALLAELESKVKKQNAKEDSDLRRAAVIQDADIVCATLSASSNSLMKNFCIKIGLSNVKPYLCCIVDEASQTTETESLLPLALEVDKLLLVGDPHQLGATVLSSLAEEKGYGQSLFSRLYDFYRMKGIKDNPIMMLKRQYRMHEEIVKWPNIYFYDEQLTTYYKPPSSNYPLRPYYFINLTTGQEQASGGQIENSKEVELVKAVIDVLEETLLPLHNQWTLGVTTPYSKQKSTLKKQFLDKRFMSFASIDVDTVDGFQGQEKDIIIVSCVRTDSTGFLKSRNRLNVALTRAKHSLYIIGDARCLSKDDMWRCLIQDAAQRNCKFDVQSDFDVNLNVLKSSLQVKLSEKMVR